MLYFKPWKLENTFKVSIANFVARSICNNINLQSERHTTVSPDLIQSLYSFFLIFLFLLSDISNVIFLAPPSPPRLTNSPDNYDINTVVSHLTCKHRLNWCLLNCLMYIGENSICESFGDRRESALSTINSFCSSKVLITKNLVNAHSVAMLIAGVYSLRRAHSRHIVVGRREFSQYRSCIRAFCGAHVVVRCFLANL